jgi:drug/metabolite transporter superfamily protein YnfA
MAGGGLIGGLFLAIRASQQASPKVLGVECVVAALILAVVLATLPLSREKNAAQGGVVVLASLLAYASLAL